MKDKGTDYCLTEHLMLCCAAGDVEVGISVVVVVGGGVFFFFCQKLRKRLFFFFFLICLFVLDVPFSC